MEREDKRNLDVYFQNPIDRKRNSSEWLGAILRYYYALGKRNFDTLYTEKELKKNLKVGHAFKAVLIVAILFVSYLILF